MNTKQYLKHIEVIHKEHDISSITKTPNTLYLTESEDIASQLLQEGFPIAGVLTKENENCAFEGISYLFEDIDYNDLSLDLFEPTYRRLNHIPWNILETDRLLIRETTVEDVQDFVALYSDPEITEYMEDLFPYHEECEYQRNYIEKIYSMYDIGIWTIEETSTNNVIGRIGIEYTEETGVVDFGFMLGKKYHHQGFATEAGIAVIDYARQIEGIQTIRSRVNIHNKSSRILCKRLGMIEVDLNTAIQRGFIPSDSLALDEYKETSIYYIQL